MNKIPYLLLLCSLLFSCGKFSSSTHKQKTLRMNISEEPASLDPRKAGDLISCQLQFFLFEGLTRSTPDGIIVLAQAESVEISKDLKTYTFHLRNSFWSNHAPLTAKDFELPWKTILSPHFSSPNSHLFYPIKNAELVKSGTLPLSEVGIWAKNDKTLVIELEKPTPYFLSLLSLSSFFPLPSTTKTHPQWAKNASSHFICNGPFTLNQWKHNHEIVFKKNPLYWQKNQIKLDQVCVSMVSDENSVMSLFEKKELDVIGLGMSNISISYVQENQKTDKIRSHLTAGTSFISFNTQRSPFHNIHIRKALAYAICRKEITQNLLPLSADIATNFIPPVLRKNSNPILFEDNDTFLAKEHFKKGLQELGISLQEFPSLVYLYSTASEINRSLAQTLQQTWLNILGVHIQLQACERKTLMENLKNRNYDLAQSFCIAQYQDPMDILDRFKLKENVKNYPAWENRTYQKLLDDSLLLSSFEERIQLLEQAEKILLEEMPLAPIYHWKSLYMTQPHISISGFEPHGFFDYSRLDLIQNEL